MLLFFYFAVLYLSIIGGIMFIRITITDQKDQERTIALNTSQIAFIDEDVIHMSNAAFFRVVGESIKTLDESLYGTGIEATPGASEHTATLLNELNKLLGGRGEAKPTTDRKARLKSRLKDFTEDELKLAASNLGADEFMQGANDNGKRYGTIDYLLRTSANVNKWLEEQPQKKKSMF